MDSKVTSILSYLGILWLVAYFAGSKDEKSIYHLRQGFGLFLLSIVFNILYFSLPAKLTMIASIVGLFLFVLFILGLINAIKEEKKPLPIVGKSFEGFTFIK
ncbi:hypothetical protein [Capnocytophaga sputigena]|uniref:hypothetical protein n=1 Tax=Capnocytophaga sputigena TaxID=1019 RepID=UPI00288B038F|nr:hypothetical protein [Capnocytophaga sputigena]